MNKSNDIFPFPHAIQWEMIRSQCAFAYTLGKVMILYRNWKSRLWPARATSYQHHAHELIVMLILKFLSSSWKTRRPTHRPHFSFVLWFFVLSYFCRPVGFFFLRRRRAVSVEHLLPFCRIVQRNFIARCRHVVFIRLKIAQV